MVKSEEARVTVLPVEELEKVAEIDISFIRLPLISDDYIKNGLITICNDAFWTFGYGGVLMAKKVRLKQFNWACWVGTVEVYKPVGATPFPWALIAGFILGAILAGVIIYFVVVRPLKEVLQEVARDIGDVIAEKEEALAEGLIDVDVAAKLNEMLEEAKEKSEDAGEDWMYDWMKWLEPLVKALPVILGVVLLIAVIGLIPRRRD